MCAHVNRENGASASTCMAAARFRLRGHNHGSRSAFHGESFFSSGWATGLAAACPYCLVLDRIRGAVTRVSSDLYVLCCVGLRCVWELVIITIPAQRKNDTVRSTSDKAPPPRPLLDSPSGILRKFSLNCHGLHRQGNGGPFVFFLTL